LCKSDSKKCDVKEAFLKYKCKSVTKLNTVDEIKKSIYENGPLIAQMMIYDDFWTYKGVEPYTHKSVNYVGPSIVKLIGYEPGFWIGEGIYGQTWGDNGYFKIKAGYLELDKFAYECEPVP